MRKINHIVIHCTATHPATTIEAIQRYWRTPKPLGQGWKSPGYHYIIKTDGSIVQLSSEEKVTNGVAGYNLDSIHVSYIGGINKDKKSFDTRTLEQITSIRALIIKLKARYPHARILGHRDFPNVKKDCPSFNVKDWLKKEGIENLSAIENKKSDLN